MIDHEKLADMRRSRGFSQQMLASRAGISQQAISAWERRRRGYNISYSALHALARALDVEEGALLSPSEPGDGHVAGMAN